MQDTAGPTLEPSSAPSQFRSGVDLIKATASFSSESRWQSWFHSLSTAAILAAALAGSALNADLPARILCSVLAGLVIVRMFVIYHDHQHGAILRGSRLASLLMGIFGILVLAPSSVWRSSHDYHHKHNSKLRVAHIGSFPVMTAERYREASRGERLKYLFMRHPLTIALAYLFAFLWGMCLAPGLRSPRRHWDGLLATALHVAIGVLLVVYGGWTSLLLVQTIPHLIASALGGYLFYAQHNFPQVTFFSSEGWTYHAAALESSSCMRMGPLMRWFTANIGYHHIHHLNARIPFYRLPQVMAALPELQQPKTTSLNPLEIWRCLRLKVWDSDAGRLVPLAKS